MKYYINSNTSNTTQPLVSVVMGCYNNESTIKEAIQSILKQTISNFEFIIIDDCSKDTTIEIINHFNDKRIILIKNSINKGLGYSLNIGINISKGKYIARMDADDIALPTRLEKQINYLMQNQNVMCIGTGSKKIGEISFSTLLFSNKIIPPKTHEEIKARLLLGTPILHPSVMFNSTLLKTSNLNYDPSFSKAQDYELWSRMIWIGTINNIKDILMLYRYSNKQSSFIHRETQISNSIAIYKRMLSKLIDRDITDAEIKIHSLFATKNKLTKEEFLQVKLWLELLLPYITRTQNFEKLYVINFFSTRWSVICRHSKWYFSRFYHYFKLKGYRTLNTRNIIRLLIP